MNITAELNNNQNNALGKYKYKKDITHSQSEKAICYYLKTYLIVNI